MVLQNATSAATLSERLAQYIHKTSIKDLDHALRQHVKQILIYHVGLALRAVRTEERLRTTTGRVYVQEGQKFRHPPEPARDIMEREAPGILPRNKIERLLEMIERLEEISDMAQLVECLTP